MKMCSKNSGPRRNFSKVFGQILESCVFIWPLDNFPCQVGPRHIRLAPGSSNLVFRSWRTSGGKFFIWWKSWPEKLEYMTRIFIHHCSSRAFPESPELCQGSPDPRKQTNVMTKSWKYDEKYFWPKNENMMKKVARNIRIYDQNYFSRWQSYSTPRYSQIMSWSAGPTDTC